MNEAVNHLRNFRFVQLLEPNYKITKPAQKMMYDHLNSLLDVQAAAKQRIFPPFSLRRLLETVFTPTKNESVAILIDLPAPEKIKDLEFLSDPSLSIQRHAYDVFHAGLLRGEVPSLSYNQENLFAYKITGGSNLDLPPIAFNIYGQAFKLEEDVFPKFDIILCISTYSATAPLTAFARKYGFRGATLHGLNPTILATGLSVDYREVSRDAEKLRKGLTFAEKVEIDFSIHHRDTTLTLVLNGQEAQKSHGLCPPGEPDVANLPAGEVYFVPDSAYGQFPLVYEDGSCGLMHVEDGRIVFAELLSGNTTTIAEHNKKLNSDPVTGIIGELGFGTQILPFAGRDIQDEKVLGTIHVATGRSDHLGGFLTPDKFVHHSNATHDDILFAPHKTPQVQVRQARAYWADGTTRVILENYRPSKWFYGLINTDPAVDSLIR